MLESEALPENHFRPQPPDQSERSRALDPAQSFLVQAPAGSGKTYLLTQRFLRLLAQAEKPDEIVAITFTNAAAAEMRNRILDALEKAELEWVEGGDPESLPVLAARALDRAKLLGWQILDLPGQLRITTIDAFCRSLALQSPLSWGLLSGLGGRLDPVSNAGELYRRAAARTLELLRSDDSPTRRSVEAVLQWRDNNWKDVEDLIVQMLDQRNRWYQEFVFARDGNWEALRNRLETPFRRAACNRLEFLSQMLDGLPGCREFALDLARFACQNPGKSSPFSLAERAELPAVFTANDSSEDEALILEDAIEAYRDLANFLLKKDGDWRTAKGLNATFGFPAKPDSSREKARFAELLKSLAEEPGLQAALRIFQKQMPARYTDPEWELIRHCFAVLRFAAGQLQVAFAESGSVDFTEVAQIALRILAPENDFPSDFAMRQADGIRHLLIDEFQDTSRNQHQLLSRLIAAWPEREGRSCFCVGDPMQSIYGFREAEVELFERLKMHGLENSSDPLAEPFRFKFASLRANFRTAPSLVEDLNRHFEHIFAEDDGSGVRFFPAEAARDSRSLARTELHLAFTPRGNLEDAESIRQSQLNEVVALVRSKLESMSRIREVANEQPQKEKYRIAVLGRTRNSLVRIAEALHEAGIGFRAIDLVPLRQQPEVLDVLSLARALLNPTDRTAWLGVLRVPWCGLTLAELHLLTSADDAEICITPIPTILESRLPMLFEQGLLDSRAFAVASRVGRVLRSAADTRSSASSTALGTWLESVWKALGGSDTVNAEERENLRLLWTALDKLPEGELDLLGHGLDAALDELYALPDPAASSDFGVQLMTIHKSKGLEFEVVIVPDLEAEGRKSERTMISWLERGLAGSDPGDEDGQLTEFLIAPIQAKGADAGAAKKWVDGIKRERERQELRRLLYVAATRAREELHLFARPRFTINQSSEEYTLASPTGLLATAWPAIEEEVQAQFHTWLEDIASAEKQENEAALELETLAAEASNLIQMPSPAQPIVRPTILRRLPAGYIAPEFPGWSGSSAIRETSGSLKAEQLFERTEGGLQSRLRGTAVHELLERLSRLRQGMNPHEAAQALASSLPVITATLRGHGLSRGTAERLANDALTTAQQVSTHPVGAWILAPHPHADAEARWTGMIKSGQEQERQWNLRPDRIFFAPAIGESEPVWWVIDYKTSHAAETTLADETEKQTYLKAHREQYVGQLAAYAQVLRGLRREEAAGKILTIRTGIFYPLLQILDDWEAG